MRVGTKSLLVGGHQFLLHPLMVWIAWWKLYGKPALDPRIILAMIVHDWGYWGKPEMDGEQGKQHPTLGANIVHKLLYSDNDPDDAWKWWKFTAYHSRSYAKFYGESPSKLCAADKLASAITPWWLYIPMVELSGEIEEYMDNAAKADRSKIPEDLWWGGVSRDAGCWYSGMVQHMKAAAYREAKPFING